MIALLNPRSARWNYRFPLSVMQIGAALENRYPYEIIDENINKEALRRIEILASSGGLKHIGITVMPGPQLFRATMISKHLKHRFPDITITWGGYFASLHASTILKSGYVDYVVRGRGEHTFLELIDILERNSTGKLEAVRGLCFKRDGQTVLNPHRELTDPNRWPKLPYHRIEGKHYVRKTYLGTKTAGYYSSVGCPFLCGFCAVASIYKAGWLGKSPDAMAQDIGELQGRYGVNAIEFFDENFFTSEKRTHEFGLKMIGRGISWWGEGRPDTVLNYSDETFRIMRDSCCKMIFFGAESSSVEVLEKMHKGGTQTPDTVLQLAERLRHFGIVPEFSFIFGTPSENIDADIERDISFIRKIKEINPAAEIIIYLYAPVMFEEADLFRVAQQHGFRFPETLEEWMTPEWQNFDLRKSPVIPWLRAGHYRRIRSFERVLHGYYPTVTDLKLTDWRRKILRAISGWRYQSSTYFFPQEIRAFLRLFRYRQPEIEGL